MEISLKNLIQRFWKKTALTWLLVALEGASLVAMPMVIGWAVDGLMKNDYTGILQLAGLCIFMLLVGAGRRFYDTRAYAAIYRTVATELVKKEQKRGSPLSKVSARTGLFSEFILFLEESIPGILMEFIGLAGTMAIIIFIDFRVFLFCLASIAVTMGIYAISSRKIYRLNRGGNDELEKQVDILAAQKHAAIQQHFAGLMRWRIRLSDLETLNFSLIWIALAQVLIFTVAAVTLSGSASFGQIVSTVMYVFGFIESVMAFPLYYQQVVRLGEIARRLSEPQNSQTGRELAEETN